MALFPYATVTVDESEVDDYAQVMPRDQILPHPPLPGMVEILNWIFDEVPAHYLVVAFDDLKKLVNLVGIRARDHRDPELIEQLLYSTAICAEDAGAHLFGFGSNQTKPFYAHHRPFKFNGYVRNVMGFVEGHGLRWDPFCRLHGDVDIGLQSLLKDRITWRDDRWVFDDDQMGANKGGQVARRSAVAMAEADRKLLEKWGRRYVSIEDRNTSGIGEARTKSTQINVARRDFHIRRAGL